MGRAETGGATIQAPSGCRLAVIVSRYNGSVTRGLLDGALDALTEAGVGADQVTVLHVPGAFEVAQAARLAAATGRYDAVICLGCLVKGDTMHFEYLASATSIGIMEAAQALAVPMTFGVLTTLTEAQAAARSGPGPDNKGREAALAAVEMVTLARQLRTGASA
jgi:6,7-dimethyl-8-ribityllumazine synthase